MPWDDVRSKASAVWDSVPYTIPPAPRRGTIAIGSHGCVKRRDDRTRFVTDLCMACDLLEPRRIVAYGTDAYGSLDYPRSLGVDVLVIPSALPERFGEAHER